ncbi:glycosyltransferase [Fundicoccus culcitae]|uniref:Glycosyltransferase n=1 Tax=Fundicoccus culcitae TaxID=2969821 RepID=A0ABY5P617_9LACT|nr:glycosyltransferase [Fundicoccus culcitae]UUX34193.1 glycosyltransferase [Fundicoccus culcitae]
MNIGLFTDSYFPQVSGVATSIETLRNQLEHRGHKVIIFTTTDPNATMERGIVRLPSVPFVSFQDRRIAYRGFDRCLKIAREYNLDIVHTHTEFSLGLAGKYIASRLKIPNIHTYHTMYEKYTHYIFNGELIQANHVRVLSRMFCEKTQGVITPSVITSNKLREYNIKVPIAVIPTGVEIPSFDEARRQTFRTQLGYTDEDVVLLSLSRLSKEKNVDQVIAAFKEINQANTSTKLLVVGDGPARADLELQAKDCSAVSFVGEIDHSSVQQFYQAADLYVNASDSETQGLTYLESFANRLPIVAKSNSYLESIMPDVQFGALFDEEHSMTDVVLDYLKNKAEGIIPEIEAESLVGISAEHFGEEVEKFYHQTILNFSHQDNTMFDKLYTSIKELIHDVVIGGGSKNE